MATVSNGATVPSPNTSYTVEATTTSSATLAAPMWYASAYGVYITYGSPTTGGGFTITGNNVSCTATTTWTLVSGNYGETVSKYVNYTENPSQLRVPTVTWYKLKPLQDSPTYNLAYDAAPDTLTTSPHLTWGVTYSITTAAAATTTTARPTTTTARPTTTTARPTTTTTRPAATTTRPAATTTRHAATTTRAAATTTRPAATTTRSAATTTRPAATTTRPAATTTRPAATTTRPILTTTTPNVTITPIPVTPIPDTPDIPAEPNNPEVNGKGLIYKLYKTTDGDIVYPITVSDAVAVYLNRKKWPRWKSLSHSFNVDSLDYGTILLSGANSNIFTSEWVPCDGRTGSVTYNSSSEAFNIPDILSGYMHVPKGTTINGAPTSSNHSITTHTTTRNILTTTQIKLTTTTTTAQIMYGIVNEDNSIDIMNIPAGNYVLAYVDSEGRILENYSKITDIEQI